MIATKRSTSISGVGLLLYHSLQGVETLRTMRKLTVPTLFLCLILNFGTREDKLYYLMKVYSYSPDQSSGTFPNGFTWEKIDTQNRVEIKDPNSNVIYRGQLHIKEGSDYETMYIKLTDYKSRNSIPREVYIKELALFNRDLIDIEDKILTIDSLPIKTRVQIVEIPTVVDCYDTDLVIFDEIIVKTSCKIILPNSGDYVVWIENKCIKIFV